MIAIIYLFGVVSLLVGGVVLLAKAGEFPGDDDDLMPPAF